MQIASPLEQVSSFGVQDLRGLSHEFVREFLSVRRESSQAPPAICLFGSEKPVIDFLVAQMADEFAQNGCDYVRIESRNVRSDTKCAIREIDTRIYKLEVDYFLKHLVKGDLRDWFDSIRPSY